MSGRTADVLVAGGGTGGHVFPALALSRALVAEGLVVHHAGTAAGLEARAVPAAGLPLHLLTGAQVRGGGATRALAGLVALVRGAREASALLARLRPRLVVGVGGYASVAAVVAARLRRLPIVLQEQNAVPGWANRLCGRLATRVCLGFAGAAPWFPAGRTVHTGNPVRPEVLAAPAPPPAPGVGLLVFGGSQGARRINQATVAALALLGDVARGLRVVHQAGRGERDAVVAEYARLGLDVRVEAFIDDMGAAYRAADLVVARAGAMTCAEVTALGVPSILVPYPFAADDHQRRNAEVLVAGGAARLLLDADCDGARLADLLRALVADGAERARMAAAARALGRPHAAQDVARVCLDVLKADRT